MAESIVIVGAARTPMGAFQGDFSTLAAHDLGGAAIRAAVERAGIPADAVGEVLFGNCLMAGQGQAPARQAAFKAGLPKSAGAVTLSKMCGSGMKAAMFAHDMLLAGTHEIMVAGGMESMTNAPYLLLKGRGGYRMGHDKVYDHMMLDGLEDAYEPGRAMGTFGEDCAAKYKFSREAQDAFATASVTRAKKATESGAFATEITPVTVKGRAGEVVIKQGDEGDYFYAIVQGRCLVTRESPLNQKGIKLAELGVGETFGEEALIAEAKRNATVTMITDGVLMRLNKQDFRDLMHEPLKTAKRIVVVEASNGQLEDELRLALSLAGIRDYPRIDSVRNFGGILPQLDEIVEAREAAVEVVTADPTLRHHAALADAVRRLDESQQADYLEKA